MLDRPLGELAAAVRDGDVRPAELVQECIDRIEERDGPVHSVVVRDFDRALAAAESSPRTGALAGIPLLVKESEDVEGLRTTLGDPALADRPAATADSSQVAALRAAGTIVVGKTNIPPYVVLAQADNPVFGRTVNAVNNAHTPGGSSGGAGAALALGLAPLATGSDGGGSIRIPSSAHGLAGFKPSTGVVPIADPDPYVWSMIDTRSVMARTFADLAVALDVVAQPSVLDPYSVALNGSFVEAGGAASLAGLRVGWSPNLGYGTTQPAVLEVCEAALRRLESAGAVVEPVDGPLDADPVMDWLAIIAPETARRVLAASPDLSRFDSFVQATIQMGMAQTAQQTAAAETGRRRILTQLASVWDRFDVLASPTVSGVPPRLDANAGPDWVGYTYVFNLASIPAATIPAGRVPVPEGPPMPVGLQLSAPRLHDLRLFAAATAAAAAIDA